MTDIVSRLRRAKGSDLLPKVLLGPHDAERTCLEAADEIERLSRALSSIETATSTADGLTPEETIKINLYAHTALAEAARKDEGPEK